jgi:dTMP kinase
MVLIAFEGLDQSGKETQARLLGEHLARHGRPNRLVSFPDYETPIGKEIRLALEGGRDYGPDVMQLLYIANRYEWKPEIERSLGRGEVVLSDRYLASSVAYGEAQGLDPGWLQEVQKRLPPATLTILLDIAPETAVRRKAVGRDRYERDLGLLARVRESYLRQAATMPGWIRLDGEQPPASVADAVVRVVETRLARP